jgi:peptidyl-prolyl cis-trans isomerase A (cyclophilin A)
MKRLFLFCLAVPVMAWAVGGCPPEAPDADIPADLTAEAEAPAAVEKGESVTLKARLSPDVDPQVIVYRWFQTYGRMVEIVNADGSEAQFVAPALPAEQTLRFRVDIQTPDGVIHSATVAVLVAGDPDFGLDQTIEEDVSGDEDPQPQVRLVTSMGSIVLELDRVNAPLTVNNFLRYVDDGFYEDTIFHRVMPDFVVQGGGYDLDLVKKDTRPPIKNEADNGLKNERGTVAMARTNAPDSATSQFYINLVDNDSLDYTPENPGYAVFGRVIQGMDVVDEIAEVETESRGGLANVPVEDVVLERAERIDGGSSRGGGGGGTLSSD